MIHPVSFNITLISFTENGDLGCVFPSVNTFTTTPRLIIGYTAHCCFRLIFDLHFHPQHYQPTMRAQSQFVLPPAIPHMRLRPRYGYRENPALFYR